MLMTAHLPKLCKTSVKAIIFYSSLACDSRTSDFFKGFKSDKQNLHKFKKKKDFKMCSIDFRVKNIFSKKLTGNN